MYEVFIGYVQISQGRFNIIMTGQLLNKGDINTPYPISVLQNYAAVHAYFHLV